MQVFTYISSVAKAVGFARRNLAVFRRQCMFPQADACTFRRPETARPAAVKLGICGSPSLFFFALRGRGKQKPLSTCCRKGFGMKAVLEKKRRHPIRRCPKPQRLCSAQAVC